MPSSRHRLLCAALAVTLLPACAQQDVVRHKFPGSDFPIAMGVEVPAGKKLVFVSGSGPNVVDKNAKGFAAYGDTATQTVSTLEAIQASLKLMKLEMKDVVKMQVFLVGDPAKDNRMDFAGFMQGYRRFFGTAEQPNLPARTTVQVAALPNPGWLVEIEVTAVASN